MDEKELRNLIQDEINNSANRAMFGVVPIPYHAHTGVDSPQIDIQNTLGFVDAEWGLFRWTTLFESLDGYLTGAGTLAIDGTGVTLTTGAVATNFANIIKQPGIQTIMNWDHASRFRTSFQVGSVTSQVGYLLVGTADEDNYGFKITNATLQAYTANLSGGTAVTIATLSAATTYDIEARFYPNKQVDYFLNGVYKATIRSTLPTSVDSSSATPMEAYIETSTGVARDMDLSYWDFMQESDVALR